MSLRAKGSWLLLDNGSAALFAFLFFVITARILSPVEFGAAALALSIAQILTPMVESLFHDALIQRADLQDRHVRTATSVTLACAAVLALLLWLVAPLAARLFGAPLLASCLPWFGLALAGSALLAMPAALARRRMEFRLLAIRTVTARSIATAVGIALLLAGSGIWAVVAQFVLSAMLSAIFLMVTGATPLRIGVDRKSAGELLHFALPTMGTQLLLYANSRIVTLAIGGMMGPVAAGGWNVAMRFVEPLQTMAATTIGQLALPIYARRQTDRGGLAQAWALGSRRVAFLLVPLFIGLGACAEPVLTLFVGERWTWVAPVMAVICVVMALIMARQLCEILFTSLGLPRINLMVQVQASLLSLAGVAIGANFGLLPAAIGWSLRALPFVTSSAWLMRKRAEILLSDQARVLVGPFMAAAVMAGAIFTVEAIAPAVRSPGLRLLWLVPFGAMVYSAALLVLDGAARADAGSMFGRLRAQSSGS